MIKTNKTLCMAVLMTISSLVLANAELINSHPNDGAMLMRQAGEITLRFSENVSLEQIKIAGSDGASVPIDVAAGGKSMSVVSIALPELTPDTYTVHWDIVDPDGHQVNGSFWFMQH